MEELICDGVLVATPGGLDGLQSFGARADSADQCAAAGADADQPVPPAPLARRAAAQQGAHHGITALEVEKRPVSAVADAAEMRNIVKVEIEQARTIDLFMMFDPGHNLDERILAEQFRF